MQFSFKAWNGTKRTGLVTPFRYFDVGVVVGTCDHTAGRLCCQVDFRREGTLFGSNEFIDLLIVPHTGKDVYLRHVCLQLFFVTFS